MSHYSEAVSHLLEKDLVCPHCGAANDPTLTFVKVDVNGIAYCRTCGHGGDYRIFQLKEKR